jgi:putative membrane protein
LLRTFNLHNMELNRITKALVIFVIIDFLLFFILETFFWMQPFVYNLLLEWFNNPPANLSYETHALVLKKLFINQGFYNLFFAIGGVFGFYQLKKNPAIAYVLLLFVCFAGIGAGIVLAITSKAYLLAFLQAIPAVFAFYRIFAFYKLSANI